MNDTPPRKKRSWIPIVLGIVIVLSVLAIGGIVFSIAFFRQNVSITEMNPGAAADEFDAVRARFAGQQPLIRLVDGKPEYTGERATGAPASGSTLTTMHIMAWDDSEAQLVRLSVPFWLLRLKSGPIQLSAYSQGWDDRGVSFRVEDLERHGPGLLLDVNEAPEGRVLIWAE